MKKTNKQQRTKIFHRIGYVFLAVLIMLSNFDFSFYTSHIHAITKDEVNITSLNQAGRIFNDKNHDGKWNIGDEGIANVKVKAIDEDSQKMAAETVTDKNGVYRLKNLEDKIYTINIYIDSQMLSTFNMEKTAKVANHTVNFPKDKDDWGFQYKNVKVSERKDLALALQEDSFEDVSKEIEKITLSEKSGLLGVSANTRASNITIKREDIMYKGGYKKSVHVSAVVKKAANVLEEYRNYRYIKDGAGNLYFCVQPGVEATNGIAYAYQGGIESYSQDSAKNKRLRLIAYFASTYTLETKRYYMAAQTLIWETVGLADINWYQEIGTQNATKKEKHNHSESPIDLTKYRNDIMARVNKYDDNPSYAGETFKTSRKIGETSHTYTLKDSKNILSDPAVQLKVLYKTAGVKKAAINAQNQLYVEFANEAKYDGSTQTVKLQKVYKGNGVNQLYQAVTDKAKHQTIIRAGSIPNLAEFEVKFKITDKGLIHINKTDDDGNPVKGVIFRYGTNRAVMGHQTNPTGELGNTRTLKYDVGTIIYVQESSVPSYIIKSDEIKEITIKPGDNPVNFVNNRKSVKFTLSKISSESEKPIPNALFSYTDDDKAGWKYSAITGNDGTFTSEESFKVGTKITIAEMQAGAGFIKPIYPDNVKTLTIREDISENKVTFKNTPIKVKLNINKVNSRTQTGIDGVRFRIGTDSTMTDSTKYDEYVTANGGKIVSKEFNARSTIYYQEISGPNNIMIDNSIKKVDFFDKDIEKVIENNEKPINIKLTKVGHNNVPLSNVTFQIQQKTTSNIWNVRETLKTNSNGQAMSAFKYTIKDIEAGNLRLVETNTPTGYKKIDPIVLTTKDTINNLVLEKTIANEKIPTSFKVFKYDEDTENSASPKALKGAVFTITDVHGNVVEKLTTKDNGYAETTNLYADTQYYIKEERAPNGYEIINKGLQSLVIRKNGSGVYEYVLKVPNKPIYGFVEVNKIEKKSKKPLKGIEFTIYKNGLPIETLITNSNGYAKSQKLLADSSYEIFETYAPKQYITFFTSQKFDFLKPHADLNNENYTSTFNENNLTFTYNVKNEELFGSVDITKVDKENNAIKVPNATFAIYNRYSGLFMGKATTDANGKAKIVNLPIVNPTVDPQQGYYYIVETTPGDNHLLPTNYKKYFSLTYDHLTYSPIFENPPVKGSIEITKVDEENPSQRLANATFNLYKATDLNTVLETKTTDGNGIAKFTDIRYGEYVIKEIKAAKYHYIKPGNSQYYDQNVKGYRVKISENGKVIPIKITNPKSKIKITVTKKDDYGHMLRGAKFNLVSGSGVVLDSIITNTNGIAETKELFSEDVGDKAYLVETEKLPGYKWDKTHHMINFDAYGNTDIHIVPITVVNDIEVPALKIKKVNEDGEPVKATFNIYAEVEQMGLYYRANEDSDEVIENYLHDEVIANMALLGYDTTWLIAYEIETEKPYIKSKSSVTLDLTYDKNLQKYTLSLSKDAILDNYLSYDENSYTIWAVNKKIPINLNLIKQDDDGAFLKDAIFEITPVNPYYEKDKEPIRITTTGSSKGDTISLPYAESYFIQEVEAPYGYFKCNPQTLKLSDFESKKDNMQIIEYNYLLNITDIRQPHVKIRKINHNGKPLSAEFTFKNDLNKQFTVNTIDSGDGFTNVDFTPFWHEAMDNYEQFTIEETNVNENYQLYKGVITGSYFMTGRRMDSMKINENSDPAVDIYEEIDGSCINITVKDDWTDYDYRIKKGGNGSNSTSERIDATISFQVYSKATNSYIVSGELMDINSEVSYSMIPNIFEYMINENSNEAGYDVYMKEFSTSPGYRKLDRFKAFSFYPEKIGLDKFQDLDEHIEITRDSTNKNIFNIKLINDSKYALYLDKVDTNGDKAEASFAISGSNSKNNRNYYETFSTVNGTTDLTPALQAMKNLDSENNWLVSVNEISTSAGLISGGDTLKMIFDPVKAEAEDSSYLQYYWQSGNVGGLIEEPSNPNFYHFTVTNRFYDLNLKIIKKDSADPNKYLADAEFQITPEGKSPITVVTNGFATGASVGLPYAATYTIKETKAPNGYVKDDTEYVVTYEDFIDNGDDTKTLIKEFTNDKIQGKLKVMKYDQDNDSVDPKEFKGTKFELYKGVLPVTGTDAEKYEQVTDGETYKLVDTIMIGEDGTATSIELPYGNYIVKEITTTDNYQLSKICMQTEIKQDNEVVLIPFGNALKKGSLKIYKYDGDTKNGLAGATFTVHNRETNEQVGDEYTTKEDGTIGPITLPYGEYYVKEISFPPGYVSTKGELHYFALDNETTNKEIKIANTKAKYALQIIKTDEITNTRLAFAEFGLFHQGDSPYKETPAEPIQTVSTNIDGVATIMLDQAGDYDVYELKAPDGYILDKTKHTIHVDDEVNTVTLSVTNAKDTMQVEILKEDEDTQQRLAGAYFEIRNALTDEIVKKVGPTGDNGQVAVELPADTIDYTVREVIAPDGYKLNNEIFNVVANRIEEDDGTIHYETEPIVVSDRLLHGNITLLKIDKIDKHPLAGAIFSVYNETGTEVDQLITNSEGRASSNDLPNGKYTLKESKAPDGYKLSDIVYQAELSADKTVCEITAENELLKGGFMIRKTDIQDESISLKGAEFTLYQTKADADAKHADMMVQVTDETGFAVFDELDYGTYYVRETKAPDGYVLSDEIHEIKVNSTANTHTIEINNIAFPKSAYFTVMKYDKDTFEALAGAEFEVSGPHNYQKTYVTDGTGSFMSEALPFGIYQVTETKAPDGYKLSEPNTQMITLALANVEQPTTYAFYNEKIMSSITIHKTDDASENPKKLQGAVFNIYELDEQNQKIEPQIDTLVTNEEGYAESIRLPKGRYKVEEIMAPYGYDFITTTEEDKIIEINENSPSVIDKTYVNKAIAGSLTIRKTDSETGEPLPNVGFTIYDSEQVAFKTIYTSSKAEDKGVAKVTDIPAGSYTVKETSVPNGYMVKEDWQESFVIGIDQTTRDITLHVENQPIKGKIRLIKTDSKDSSIGIGGARYGIYKELEIKPDGTQDVLEKSYLGENYDVITLPDADVEIVDDDTGEHYIVRKHQEAISQELPLGTYYVKELASPKEYKLNDKIYTVNLNDEVNDLLVLAEDEKYEGNVVIHKKDAANDKPLANAVFALYDAQDYETMIQDPEANIPVRYLTTDDKGMAKVDGLLLGNSYVVCEFRAPDGYRKDPNDIKRFTVTADKLDFEYVFTNDKISEIVIYKVDDFKNPVEGVTFGLYGYGDDHKAGTSDDVFIDIFGTGFDNRGIARYETTALKNGWYYVKELSNVTAGFELSKELKTFEITDDKHEYTFEFVNHLRKGDVEIWKKDETGKPLKGAKFALFKPGESWYKPGVTENSDVWLQDFEMDEDAHGIIKNLETNCYVIKEVETPAGYKKMDDYFFDLRYGDIKETNDRSYYYYGVEFNNYPIEGNIEIQKEIRNTTNITAELNLSNAIFQILDNQDTVVDTLISDNAGKAVSQKLPMGIYKIKEIQAPDGTILNKEIGYVEIDGSQKDDLYNFTFTNDIATGKLKLIKVNEQGDRLKDAEFTITPYGSATILDTLKTDVNGEAVSKDLPYGWYTIRETKAPDGYSIDASMQMNYQIKDHNEIVEITIVNKLQSETGLQVFKFDKDNPNKFLADAVFALYTAADTENELGRYTTQADGSFKIEDLADGDYVLKEVTAPEGYKLDPTPHTFTWKKDTSIALYLTNEVKKGRLTFEKNGDILTQLKDSTAYPELKELVYETENLEGATIGIYAAKDIMIEGKSYQKGDLIQLLNSGETSKYLPVGNYVYKECKAPNAYLMDTNEHVVEVKEETDIHHTQIVQLMNQHASAQIELYKKFTDSENPDLFNKVKFGVYTATDIDIPKVNVAADEDAVWTIPENTLVAVIEVDEYGHSKENHQKLPLGEYFIKELDTAEGYIIDNQKHHFKLDYANKDVTVTISTKEQPLWNEPVYGQIELKKTGAMFNDVQKSQEYDMSVVKPVYTEDELQGAVVEVKAAEKLMIDNHTYQPGDVVDTLISGKKNKSIKLPFGKYTAQEMEAPSGYVIDPTIHQIELTASSNTNSITYYELKIYNQKKDIELQLYKSFFQKEDATLYQDVMFGVYAEEKIIGNRNEAVLEKDDLVALMFVDETGKASLKSKLPTGKYYVKELKTATGYQVSDKTYHFTIMDDSEGIIPIKDMSKQEPLMNYPNGSLTPFKFRKTDETGNSLAGATFKLYTCDKKHAHAASVDDAQDCWQEIHGLSPKTSDENGIIDFQYLPDGDYQLKETSAPIGYELPKAQWFLHVDAAATEKIVFETKGKPLPPAFMKVKDQDWQYEIKNLKQQNLPIMGGEGSIVYIGCGGILLGLALLLIVRKKGGLQK